MLNSTRRLGLCNCNAPCRGLHVPRTRRMLRCGAARRQVASRGPTLAERPNACERFGHAQENLRR